MKDLDPTQKILGMQITRDKHRGILQLSQLEYINRVLQRFDMGDTKLVIAPFARHLHLSKDQSPQIKQERDFMSKVPYALRHWEFDVSVCTRPNIGYAVGVVISFMENFGKVHWEGLKWSLRCL